MINPVVEDEFGDDETDVDCELHGHCQCWHEDGQCCDCGEYPGDDDSY